MSIESVVAQLKEERSRLDRAIAEQEGLDLTSSSAPRGPASEPVRPANNKRRRLTPAGRRHLSELMKQRWAQRRKQQGYLKGRAKA